MALSDAVPFVVAAYALNEASGNAIDSVGSNDLTDNGTVGSAAGFFGTARDFEFDNSEYFNHADNPTLTTGNVDWYMTGIIKPESVDASHIIASKIGGGGGEFKLYITSGSKVTLHVYASSGFGGEVGLDANTFGVLSPGTTYVVDCWHDSVNDLIGVSVNGVKDTLAHSTGVFDSSEDFQIGAQAPFGEYFDGLIEDFVFIKGYILDDTERAERYGGGAFKALADWDAGGEEPATPANVIYVGL